jgi:GDP-L-fucose synthase
MADPGGGDVGAGIDPRARIYVAGHRGLVGSAVVRALRARGIGELLLRTRAELDLLSQSAVEAFFAAERPALVVLAAAKVGGIAANDRLRADFIWQNLTIQNQVIHAAWRHGVRKLLFLGSSCIYPRDCPQPMREEHLLTGPLERTNEAYAVAKIAGLMTCQSFNRQYGTCFVSLQPTNLYGPGDNYDLANSHVLPALLRKFHEAAAGGHGPVTVWGSGRPLREFLHVDDLAEACLFALGRLEAGSAGGDLYNVGSGQEVSVRELALTVQRVVGHRGELVWDAQKPDGTPRKLLDCSRLSQLGWTARIGLEQGIRSTYQAFLSDSRRG